ncbi:MAG: hypothetical protein J2P17_24375, partial [Mycobacterium sp.]|nr:hypothetical protein [Mycobacterium sp.]
MNQFDLATTPTYKAFTSKPGAPNKVPLAPSTNAAMPTGRHPMQQAWTRWADSAFAGPNFVPDSRTTMLATAISG